MFMIDLQKKEAIKIANRRNVIVVLDTLPLALCNYSHSMRLYMEPFHIYVNC